MGGGACTGDRRGSYKVLMGKLRKRVHLEYLGISDSIILK